MLSALLAFFRGADADRLSVRDRREEIRVWLRAVAKEWRRGK